MQDRCCKTTQTLTCDMLSLFSAESHHNMMTCKFSEKTNLMCRTTEVVER